MGEWVGERGEERERGPQRAMRARALLSGREGRKEMVNGAEGRTRRDDLRACVCGGVIGVVRGGESRRGEGERERDMALPHRSSYPVESSMRGNGGWKGEKDLQEKEGGFELNWD